MEASGEGAAPSKWPDRRHYLDPELANKLRVARLELGWSLKDMVDFIATLTGSEHRLNKGHLSRLERGQRAPSVELVEVLCLALPLSEEVKDRLRGAAVTVGKPKPAVREAAERARAAHAAAFPPPKPHVETTEEWRRKHLKPVMVDAEPDWFAWGYVRVQPDETGSVPYEVARHNQLVTARRLEQAKAWERAADHSAARPRRMRSYRTWRF